VLAAGGVIAVAVEAGGPRGKEDDAACWAQRGAGLGDGFGEVICRVKVEQIVCGQWFQEGIEAGGGLADGDDGVGRSGLDGVGEVVPVKVAVITAENQGDALTFVDFKGRQCGMGGGADGVVDPEDALALAQGLQAVGEWGEGLEVVG